MSPTGFASWATARSNPTRMPRERAIARLGLHFTNWAERWFPDAYVFVCLAVAVVGAAAMINGAAPSVVAKSFGDGFWSLITFTMQMAVVAIGGYVVASSPPATKLIDGLAAIPRRGRGAIGFVAAVSMITSLLSWGLSLIFSGQLVLALAKRADLHMDYRAAGAAAYLGVGAIWALGLSSSAAQLQANAASLPKSLVPITGIIPFSETIFLWQSMVLAVALVVVSIVLARLSAPSDSTSVTAGSHRSLHRRIGSWLFPISIRTTCCSSCLACSYTGGPAASSMPSPRQCRLRPGC